MAACSSASTGDSAPTGIPTGKPSASRTVSASPSATGGSAANSVRIDLPTETISFTRRGVAWGNGSGNGDPSEYVLTVNTGKLEKVGQQQGFNVIRGNPATDTILWAFNPDEEAVMVVWQRGTLR